METKTKFEEIIKTKQFQIGSYGKDVTVKPTLFRYNVKDFLNRDASIIGIRLMMNSEYGEEPFATLTKSFGEFIGQKNCAYIDLNNLPSATALLDYGIATETGFSMHSGFCEYPLWRFDENFLKAIGGNDYMKYSEEFDKIMSFEEEIEEGEEQTME